MAKDDPHFRLRIPAELKAEIEASAAANNRSINAEIVSRLQSVGDERKLLHAALNLMERLQESERSNIKVMQWLRDQMSGQAAVIERIAATEGRLDKETLALLRELVATKGHDNDFPLTREEIEAFGSERSELGSERHNLKLLLSKLFNE